MKNELTLEDYTYCAKLVVLTVNAIDSLEEEDQRGLTEEAVGFESNLEGWIRFEP